MIHLPYMFIGLIGRFLTLRRNPRYMISKKDRKSFYHCLELKIFKNWKVHPDHRYLEKLLKKFEGRYQLFP